MNGDRVGGIEDAPRMKLAKEILIGGDIYEKSFRGRVADLRIFMQYKMHFPIILPPPLMPIN